MDFAELGFTRAGWDSPVLNPTASEASYKPKQRSYTKTNLKKKVLVPNSPGAEMSGAELSSAETAAHKRTRPTSHPSPPQKSLIPHVLAAYDKV